MESSGQRSVSIGGNVSGGLIVTGDSNFIRSIGDRSASAAGAEPSAPESLPEQFEYLGREVRSQAPPGLKSEGVDRVDALRFKLSRTPPELDALVEMQDWLQLNVPSCVELLAPILLEVPLRPLVASRSDIVLTQIGLQRKRLSELQVQINTARSPDAKARASVRHATNERWLGELEALASH